MNKRDEWLADTLQKIGLGFFLGAFFKGEGLVLSVILVALGTLILVAAYLLTPKSG